jgi:glutathione S-transferase
LPFTSDARGRALVDMHMKLCDLQFTRHAGTIIFPKRFLPKEKWNNIAMAEAKAEIEKHLAMLDQHLAAKTYLVAEQFSLADVCYMPFLESTGRSSDDLTGLRVGFETHACLAMRRESSMTEAA